jgi:hypothetical protein
VVFVEDSQFYEFVHWEVVNRGNVQIKRSFRFTSIPNRISEEKVVECNVMFVILCVAHTNKRIKNEPWRLFILQLLILNLRRSCV